MAVKTVLVLLKAGCIALFTSDRRTKSGYIPIKSPALQKQLKKN